jgi:succinate dehydrogenase/fumarate reductase flavoprotein subunit
MIDYADFEVQVLVVGSGPAGLMTCLQVFPQATK